MECTSESEHVYVTKRACTRHTKTMQRRHARHTKRVPLLLGYAWIQTYSLHQFSNYGHADDSA